MYRVIDLLGAQAQLPVYYPPPVLCTDNGVMVAWAAVERLAACAGGSGVAATDEVGVQLQGEGGSPVYTDLALARWPLVKA